MFTQSLGSVSPHFGSWAMMPICLSSVAMPACPPPPPPMPYVYHPSYPNSSLRKQDVHYIVVHCSATRENQPYSASQLDRDHRRRGFNGAGYHFYVRRSGVIVPLRPIDQMGAHVYGYNRMSIGVCYEGGLSAEGKPKDTRTPLQKGVLMKLLMQLQELFPNARIVGHRSFSPDRDGNGIISPDEWVKACPCFDIECELKRTSGQIH